jgi:hypothetical protein
LGGFPYDERDIASQRFDGTTFGVLYSDAERTLRIGKATDDLVAPFTELACQN